MSADVRLTIGELAAAAGMTVRNIRNHQSRGLLPPPELEARTGYYGPEHLERLKLIKAMQADGLNLEAIRRLLSGSELLRAATLPSEAPVALTADEVTSSMPAVPTGSGARVSGSTMQTETLGTGRPTEPSLQSTSGLCERLEGMFTDTSGESSVVP